MILSEITAETKHHTVILVKCDRCGKEKEISFRSWLQNHGKIPIKEYHNRKGNQLDFCSSCKIKIQHENQTADQRKEIMNKAAGRPEGYRPKETSTCSVCGKAFDVKSRMSYSHVLQTCSNECASIGKGWYSRLDPQDPIAKDFRDLRANLWMGKKNPKWGKPADHGKTTTVVIDGKLYFFRSRWEAVYAIALQNEGKAWEYEPNTFVLSNGMSYTPDFLVEGRYIEVKGFWRDDARIKWDLFCKEFAEYQPILITCEELTKILSFSPRNGKKLNKFLEPYLAP